MTWDKSEVIVLIVALICITILSALKIISESFVEAQFTLIVGYAIGRIFNQKQGKE